LPASRAFFCAGSVVPASTLRKVSISPNTEAVSAKVSGVGAISAPFGAAST